MEATYVYDTASNPTVGSGLDDDGHLAPGYTWAVFLSEILDTLEVAEFVGFGWFVANFDSVAGTYVNFFSALGTGQSFEMQPPLGGSPL